MPMVPELQMMPHAERRDERNADTARTIVVAHDESDMTEMLNELRILQLAAQLLTGFLITLPFNSGFQGIVTIEKWMYMATFLCSLSSLVLLIAPAVQHRVLRPLRDRGAFKNQASRLMIAGAIFLSLALILCATLVTAEVVGHSLGGAIGGVAAFGVAALWWIYPWWLRRSHLRQQNTKPALSDL